MFQNLFVSKGYKNSDSQAHMHIILFLNVSPQVGEFRENKIGNLLIFLFYVLYVFVEGLVKVLHSFLKSSEYFYDHYFKFSIRHKTYLHLLRTLAMTLFCSFI